jgi:hypothetical protein
MNLIDCKHNVIVEAKNNAPWLALSYVWGSNQQSQDSIAGPDGEGYSAGCHLPSTTARTVLDAMVVTRELGYRYLWVDEYCINQTNESHRTAQIGIMDRIYQGADLTIVAAAGEDKWYGLPGINNATCRRGKRIDISEMTIFTNGPVPEQDTRESTWFSRAWWVNL